MFVWLVVEISFSTVESNAILFCKLESINVRNFIKRPIKLVSEVTPIFLKCPKTYDFLLLFYENAKEKKLLHCIYLKNM